MGVVLALACASIALHAAALPQAASPAAPADTASAAQRLLTWADQSYPKPLAEGRFSAAGIVWVTAAGDVQMRGYGLENVASKRAFEAQNSLFRVQSVTKVFTALGVLELLRQGRLASLDDPANRYLKRLQLPRVGERDVSVRDLLTHKAGLDPLAYRFAAPAPLNAMLSAQAIAAVLPPPAHPAGAAVMYSNAAYGVAGLLIEDITGQELDAALKALVFKPLGMDATFIGHPAVWPERMVLPAGRFPNGDPYDLSDPALNPLTHPILRASGSLYTTLPDMGRFLKWQLGALAGDSAAQATLLGPQGAQALLQDKAANHPSLDPVGLGYLHREWNGQTTLEKGGAPGFNTRLLLLPQMGLGLFTVQADASPTARPEDELWAKLGTGRFTGPPVPTGFDSRSGLLKALLGDYVRPPRAAAAAVAAVTDSKPMAPAELAGDYWFTQRPRNAPWLVMYLPAVHRVSVAADGALVINGHRQQAYGADAYAPADGPVRGGQVTGFVRDARTGQPQLRDIDQAFDRVSGLGNPTLLQPLWLTATALAATGLLADLWRRRLWAGVVLALAALAVPVALWLGFAPGTSFETDMMRGVPTRLVMLALASHAALLCVPMLAWRLWRLFQGTGDLPTWRDRGAALHALVLLAAALALTVVYVQLNWIGRAIPL
jgi:CubicO group peptidase (beta-lactamase class C family)